MATELNSSLAADKRTVINIDELCLRIAGRSLIRDFTLQVGRGSRIGLTGPSGCGKTTLLRAIVGRRLGNDSIANRFDITKEPIGYVSQEGGLLPWYSVRRNLQIFASPQGESEDNTCDDILDRMQLSHISSAFPDELSGGELQRLRLACAMVTRASVYCADEPLTEIALSQRWQLLEHWSRDISERQNSLILISHDVDTLIYLCDTIFVLGGPTGEPAAVLAKCVTSIGPHPRPINRLNSAVADRQQLINYLRPPTERTS